MNQTPTWVYVLQIVTTLAVVGTFFIYLSQLKAMQSQLSLVAQAGRAHNLITLNGVITEPSFREARKVLIGLRGKPLSTWDPEDRRLAEKACALWNFAAQIVIELGIPDSVVKDLKYSVTQCHDAATELLADVRKTRAPEHWRHFTELAKKVAA